MKQFIKEDVSENIISNLNQIRDKRIERLNKYRDEIFEEGDKVWVYQNYNNKEGIVVGKNHTREYYMDAEGIKIRTHVDDIIKINVEDFEETVKGGG